jgi:hypothetical protein
LLTQVPLGASTKFSKTCPRASLNNSTPLGWVRGAQAVIIPPPNSYWPEILAFCLSRHALKRQPHQCQPHRVQAREEQANGMRHPTA